MNGKGATLESESGKIRLHVALEHIEGSEDGHAIRV